MRLCLSDSMWNLQDCQWLGVRHLLLHPGLDLDATCDEGCTVEHLIASSEDVSPLQKRFTLDIDALVYVFVCV